VTIEKPMPIRTMPIPTVQRRSKPVNGSDLALLVGLVVLVGAALVVAGAVVVVGVLLSFDGDVPVVGVGVVLVGVVLVGVVLVGVVLVGVVLVVGGGGVWL
jgi:hypothetical protein